MGRQAGVSEKQLSELADFRRSDAFNESERLVVAYAEAMTKTPVDVPDDLFADLRKQFSEAQLVELTAEIAWENWRARFDHALGIGSQGFSEGSYCALPERPAAAAS